MTSGPERVAEQPAEAAAVSGRQTALVAIGQGALMILGGVLALLVAQIFGKNAKTDAFFAAYGVYSVGLTFGQTFRLTAVSRLVHSRDSETITRLLGAVGVMMFIAGIPMLVLARPLGHLLVTSDTGGVAPTALRILWVALAGQLLAAMLATILAVRGSFIAIAAATLLTGFVSVGVFLLVRSPLGIIAAPVGLAASALWLAVAFAAVLLRSGWRPTSLSLQSIRRMCSEARRLAFASATFFGSTLAYLICVAIAARQGRGEATLFAYAYVLAVVLIGVTANVTAMVRSPAVVASTRRARDAAAVGAWSFRFTLVLVGPVLAMAILVGRPVIGLALGSGFSSANIREILITLLCLVGWILASAAGIFAIVELLARGELRRLATLSAVLVAVLPGLAIAGSALAGIPGIAAALSLSMLSATAVQMGWAFGSSWRHEAIVLLRASLRELIVLLTAFAPAAVLLAIMSETVLGTTVAAAVAALLAAIATRIAWPREWQALLGVFRRSPQGTAAPADARKAPAVTGDESADVLRAL